MSAEALTVHVNGADGVIDDADVARAVRTTAMAEQVEAGEFSVTFVDEVEIARLNREYLDRDGPTDVIAFDLGTRERPLGDIYISPDTARGYATEDDIPVREELLRLVVHGVLHVLGHDHPAGPDRTESEMFRRQEAILARVLDPDGPRVDEAGASE